MEGWFEVCYSCEDCGLKLRRVKVRLRHTNEDMLHYVGDTVARAIGHDHHLMSPVCFAKTISQMFMPLDKENDEGIGFTAASFPAGFDPKVSA